MTKYMKFWQDRIPQRETPFFASSMSSLKPSIIPSDIGDHLSVVFDPGGLRYWCFTSQANRDRFLTYFRRVYDARPCGNPHP